MTSLLALAISLFFSLTTYALTNAQPAVEAHEEAQVMIRSEGRTSDGESAPGYCNATLVSPRILVTAAHCLAQSWYLRDNVIQVSVGRYKYVTRPDGKVVRVGYATYLRSDETAQILMSARVQDLMRSQGVMGDSSIPPEEDYAVAILSRPLSLAPDFPYRRIVAKALLAQVIQTAANLTPMIVTENPTAEMATADSKRFAVLDDLSWNDSGWFESQSLARVQEGDSGSGLLVKIGAEYQLVAVVKGKASSFFSDWDVYPVVVGKICDLVQGSGFSTGLNVDEKADLCR